MNKTRLSIFLIVVIFFISKKNHGQNNEHSVELDSLKTLLTQATSDTSRLDLYLSILKHSSKADLSEINKLEQNSLILARRLSSIRPDGERMVMFRTGEVLYAQGKTKASKEKFRQVLQLTKESLDSFLMAKTFGFLANNAKIEGDFNMALKFLSEGVTVAEEINEPQLVGEMKNTMSTIYRDKGEIPKALQLLNECIAAAEPLDDKINLASYYNTKGRIYRGLAKYDSAQIFYMKSYDLAVAMKMKRQMAVMSNNLGNIAQTTGDLEKALEYYVTSLKLKEEIGDKKGVAITYHNIGSVKFDLKDFDNAREDFEKSQLLALETSYKILMIHNFQKIGNVFFEKDSIEKALKFHKQSVDISQAINFKSGMIEGKRNLGKDYNRIQQYEKSFECLYESLKLAKEQGRKKEKSLALIAICETYMDLSKNSEINIELVRVNNFTNKEIELTLIQANAIAQDIGDLNNITFSLKALQTFYKNAKSYRKEAEVSRKYIEFRDSLFNQQKANALASWETRYETAEKEKEIQLLEKEKVIQNTKARATRNRFIGGSIGLFLVGIAGWIYFYYRNKFKRAEQMTIMRTKISSDLHDDVGSLLSGLAMQTEVLALTAKEENKARLQRIGEMSRDAMSKMRDMVWAIDSRKDSIENLLDRMREFSEETLSAKNIDYNIQVENINIQKKIPADVRQNVYLIFKEAITNVIKHSNGKHVDIAFGNAGSDFEMLIQDNGVIEKKNYKTTGQGMNNMKMRAERIGGQLIFIQDGGFGIRLKRDKL